jgi:hypothetical protein
VEEIVRQVAEEHHFPEREKEDADYLVPDKPIAGRPHRTVGRQRPRP